MSTAAQSETNQPPSPDPITGFFNGLETAIDVKLFHPAYYALYCLDQILDEYPPKLYRAMEKFKVKIEVDSFAVLVALGRATAQYDPKMLAPNRITLQQTAFGKAFDSFKISTKHDLEACAKYGVVGGESPDEKAKQTRERTAEYIRRLINYANHSKPDTTDTFKQAARTVLLMGAKTGPSILSTPEVDSTYLNEIAGKILKYKPGDKTLFENLNLFISQPVYKQQSTGETK